MLRCVPPDLVKLNFIFFDEPEKFDAALARLVEALSTDIARAELSIPR